jgi:hypothetical protein
MLLHLLLQERFLDNDYTFADGGRIEDGVLERAATTQQHAMRTQTRGRCGEQISVWRGLTVVSHLERFCGDKKKAS